MSNELNRREFMKVSAATGAASGGVQECPQLSAQELKPIEWPKSGNRQR